MAARDAHRAAQSALDTARSQQAVLAELLDGTRDLATGTLKPPSEKGSRKHLGTLPPRTGPQPTDAEIAREEALASLLDADGHEVMPYPKPRRREYEAAKKDYPAALAAWERATAERHAHITNAKYAIWKSGLPDRLGTLAPSQSGGWTGRVLDAARAAFDWMRERVATAFDTLGRDDPTAKAMEGEWLDALANYAPAMDAVRADHENSAQALDGQAADMRAGTAELRREVDRKRETKRLRFAQRSRYDGPSGPGM